MVLAQGNETNQRRPVFSASTPVAGTTTSGSIAPSSSPETNPGDAAVGLRPAAAAVGAVAVVALLF